MDKIDSLIKTLTEFKEELNKNMNAPYGATTPNMTKEEMDKASKDPALAPKEVKIKELQGKIDNKTYKPDASKIADKILKEEDLDKNNRNRGKQGEQQAGYNFAHLMEGKRHSDEMERQGKANAVAPVKVIPVKDYKPQVKMLKEELTCSENGQWDIKKLEEVEKINSEDVSSKHTDPSINAALGGKYGKIHGGNPKKPTGALKDTPIHNVGGKPMKPVSGASPKRARNEAGQSTEE